VDRGHETLLDAETFLEKDMDDGSETVGGAAGVGDDVVVGNIKFIVVDTHNHRDVLSLGRSGDDDLLGACGQMTLGLFGIGEEAGALKHDIDIEIFPRKCGRAFFDGKALDLVAINDERVVLSRFG